MIWQPLAVFFAWFAGFYFARYQFYSKLSDHRYREAVGDDNVRITWFQVRAKDMLQASLLAAVVASSMLLEALF